MPNKLDLQLFSDVGYRFNDNITDSMSADKKVNYLWSEAQRFVDANEHEICYGILRELLWRLPNHSVEAWRLLAECARSMGFEDEASSANGNAILLSTRQ